MQQAKAGQASPFEWNLPEITPAGMPDGSVAVGGKTATTSEQPITSTDELFAPLDRRDELADPVLHR